MDAKEMREIVEKELEHIPRDYPGSKQNTFRAQYSSSRLHSLGKHAETEQTKEDVLKQAIDTMKKDNPEFQPNYDREFFSSLPD